MVIILTYCGCVVPHFKLGQGKLAMGNAENSGESVHNDRDGRQQGTSEQRIRLVIPRFPVGHESLKTPEFSAELMVNKGKQAVQKLSAAVQVEDWKRIVKPGALRPLSQEALVALKTADPRSLSE
jgi:hypothetical protein